MSTLVLPPVTLARFEAKIDRRDPHDSRLALAAAS